MDWRNRHGGGHDRLGARARRRPPPSTIRRRFSPQAHRCRRFGTGSISCHGRRSRAWVRMGTRSAAASCRRSICRGACSPARACASCSRCSSASRPCAAR
ncbi:MAG: hypothetical protein MZW92_11890 [Comamonadaceae bacterium]|nr:hypothetical protein [Comamonadaceae bacterium]